MFPKLEGIITDVLKDEEKGVRLEFSCEDVTRKKVVYIMPPVEADIQQGDSIEFTDANLVARDDESYALNHQNYKTVRIFRSQRMLKYLKKTKDIFSSTGKELYTKTIRGSIGF